MRKRILIVEDEAIPALELQMRLKRWGFEVTRTEARGAAAIESARADRPDLVIMDIVLADDVDGIRAADVIQAELDTGIVFLTALEGRGYASMVSRNRRLTISKPYDPDKLRTAIASLLA